MKAGVRLGKSGLSGEFLAGLDRELRLHELVKVKLEYHKSQRKVLARQMAEQTESQLVTLVGNVVVLFRPQSAEPANDSPE
jgi:RNA-binding protein